MRFYHRLIRNLTLPNNAGLNDSRMVLGPDIPAVLTSFFETFGQVYACQLAYANGTDYEYRVWILDTLSGQTAVAEGWVFGSTVIESSLTYVPNGSNAFAILYGDALNLSPTLGMSVLFRDTFGATIDPSDSLYTSVRLEDNVDFLMGTFPNIVSQGRGLQGTDGYYVGAAAIAQSAGAEVAIPAATWGSEPGYTFKNTRLYMVRVNVVVLNTAGGGFTIVRVRKGSASVVGTEFMRWQIPNGAGAGQGISSTLFCFIKNTSGNDVTSKLSLTCTKFLGAGNAALYGDAAFLLNFTIWDIGCEADHSAISTITQSV